MMIDGGFGATFDISIEPVSTAQEEFKRDMVESLRLAYGLLHFVVEPEILSKGGYLRPDLVVYLPGTTTAVMVADAKCRARIERRDVMKVASYKTATQSPRAQLWLPRTAHVTSGARLVADAEGIDLVEV